ncbi:MAG: DUF2922 domain-containing protein [Peptococcaceae bacterium]
MAETKTLQMIFANAASGRVTISVLDPRDDLNQTDVEAAMNEIIAANAVGSTGGDLAGIIGARLINRQVTDLIG